MTISLASHQRLRKLRVAESEDIISGKEYIRRLRRQFTQLHPVPGWVEQATQKQRDEDSDSDRGDGMDTDDDDEISPMQPLAKLLQGATDLTKLEDTRGGKRRLRQEMLDIHRLKDVGRDQPVSCPSLYKYTLHGN
jgi:U3 small nucleolar RNA-associated protein 18